MGKYEELYKIGISSKGKLVYFYLDDRKNADNVAWPGLNTIARELSMSRSSVRRAIQELEKIGLVRKEAHYRANGSATSNRYPQVSWLNGCYNITIYIVAGNRKAAGCGDDGLILGAIIQLIADSEAGHMEMLAGKSVISQIIDVFLQT